MPAVIFKSALITTADSPEKVSPEIRVIIEAILQSIHNCNLRIRSIKLLERPKSAGGWTTHSRAKIHASHNLHGPS